MEFVEYGGVVIQQSDAFENKYTVHGMFGNNHGQVIGVQADITINDIGIKPPMVHFTDHVN